VPICCIRPRNKILATSLLVEAFLYEEQTRRGISLKHFDEFNDVADHCTVCHRCLKPCPVDIDFGDVSVAMRNFLRKQDKKRFSPGTWPRQSPSLTLKDPATIKLMRAGMMEFGFKAQRLAHKAAKALGLVQESRELTRRYRVGAPTIKTQIIHFLNRPMPGNLPKRTSRALARHRRRQGHSR
jgi:Fe-S oxidoreductase